jgi:hypothetical protein
MQSAIVEAEGIQWKRRRGKERETERETETDTRQVEIDASSNIGCGREEGCVLCWKERADPVQEEGIDLGGEK